MATKAHDAAESHRVKAARNRQATDNTEFICECADRRCNATLDLTTSEYEDVRASSIRFSVKPGHAILRIERVVKENRRYAVVEKLRTRAGDPAR